MDSISHEPQSTDRTGSLTGSYAIRHDGWTPEKMAIFCEALAETAVVAEACEVANMGISGAYAARRRSPMFDAAWGAALSIARERLADTLLARSIEGNVEQIWRDGVLVGERHVIDNRLGLAILRRLDRLAESGTAEGRRSGLASKSPAHAAPFCNPRPLDWALAIDALRIGDDKGVARALALVEGHEVEEVEDPPISLDEGDSESGLDLSDRFWRDGIDDAWTTDFPPPEGFTGYESRPYDDPHDDEPYVRACTAEETEVLEADAAAACGAEREEQAQLRDLWLAMLREEAASADNEPDDEPSSPLAGTNGDEVAPSP